MRPIAVAWLLVSGIGSVSEQPTMRGAGSQPREEVVRVPEALSLRGEVLGLFPKDLTVELDDDRPLFEGLDIGRENRSRMPRHGDFSASESEVPGSSDLRLSVRLLRPEPRHRPAGSGRPASLPQPPLHQPVASRNRFSGRQQEG